jgi:hypothetical protein
MNNRIRSAVEIAMEKAAALDDLSEDEKEEIRNKKKLNPIMANFYRSRMKPDKLWEKFKNEDESMLRLAQINLLDSLKFGIDSIEVQRRAKAIIAIESLKKEQNTGSLQEELKKLEVLGEKAENEKKQVYSDLKTKIENDPKARTKVVEQGGAKIMLKLTVEDAIAQNPQWKQYLREYGNRYGNTFNSVIEKVKKIIL